MHVWIPHRLTGERQYVSVPSDATVLSLALEVQWGLWDDAKKLSAKELQLVQDLLEVTCGRSYWCLCESPDMNINDLGVQEGDTVVLTYCRDCALAHLEKGTPLVRDLPLFLCKQMFANDSENMFLSTQAPGCHVSHPFHDLQRRCWDSYTLGCPSNGCAVLQDRAFVMRCIRSSLQKGDNLFAQHYKHTADCLRLDASFVDEVLQTLQEYPIHPGFGTLETLFQAMPYEARDDTSIVAYFVRQRPRLLTYATERLRGDADIVISLMRLTGSGMLLSYAADRVRSSFDVIRISCGLSYSNAQYASEEALESPRLFSYLLLNDVNSHVLQFAKGAAKSDEELWIHAASLHNNALQYASPDILTNKVVAMTAVARCGYSLAYLPQYMKADNAVLLQAMCSSGYGPVAIYAETGYLTNVSFLRQARRIDPKIMRNVKWFVKIAIFLSASPFSRN